MTIAIIGLIIMAMMIPAFFCAGFYYGFNTAETVFTEQTVRKENIPGVTAMERVKDSMQTETEEERLRRILAENVENFGTDIPQKEVV